MKTPSAVRGTRKVRLSPELSEVLDMLKALERSTQSDTTPAKTV